MQQWIDSLTEIDLHGMTERPATPLEIESRAYADIHFLPIPGTGGKRLMSVYCKILSSPWDFLYFGDTRWWRFQRE